MSDLTFNVKTLGSGSTSHSITMSSTSTIEDVKNHIHVNEWMPTSDFRLLLNGRNLSNDTALDTLTITSSTTFYIVNRPTQSSNLAATPPPSTVQSPQQASQPPQPQLQQIPGMPGAFVMGGGGGQMGGLPPAMAQMLANMGGPSANPSQTGQIPPFFAQMLGMNGSTPGNSNVAVQSSMISTDQAPPPARWFPNQVYTQYNNIWEGERVYTGIVHRLPYSSRVQQSIAGLDQFSTDVEFFSNGLEDGSSEMTSSATNTLSDAASNEQDISPNQRMLSRLANPPLPIPDTVSSYSYPLHLLITSFEEALPLLTSIRDRIYNEENVTTIEEIESLRYDTRRVGTMLRRFGTASIDLGSALNHIDWGEGVPIGSMAPNPTPGEEHQPFTMPQLSAGGDASSFPDELALDSPNRQNRHPSQPITANRPLRRRNASRLRGPQMLHQTMSSMNPFQALLGTQQRTPTTRIRNAPVTRRRANRSTREIDTNTSEAPNDETVSRSVQNEEELQRQRIALGNLTPGLIDITNTEVGVEVETPLPEIPTQVAMSLPADYMTVLGHQPLGVPQPNLVSGNDMFVSGNLTPVTASSSATIPPTISNTSNNDTTEVIDETHTMDDEISASASNPASSSTRSASTRAPRAPRARANGSRNNASNTNANSFTQLLQSITSQLGGLDTGNVSMTTISLELDPETGQMRSVAPVTTFSMNTGESTSFTQESTENQNDGENDAMIDSNESTDIIIDNEPTDIAIDDFMATPNATEEATTSPPSASTTTTPAASTSTRRAPRSRRQRNANNNNPLGGLGGLFGMIGPMVSQMTQGLQTRSNNGGDDEDNVDINNAVQQVLGNLDLGSLFSQMSSGGGIDIGSIINNMTQSMANAQPSNAQENVQDGEIIHNEEELPSLLQTISAVANTQTELSSTLITALMPLMMGQAPSALTFDPTVLDSLRAPLHTQLQLDLRTLQRFYRHHPEIQTPMHTSIYPMFTKDIEYDQELSILTDRTVAGLLPMLINTQVLTQARTNALANVSANMSDDAQSQDVNMIPVTSEIVLLIRDLQSQADISLEGMLPLDASYANIDDNLISALHNQYGPLLTELVCYLIGVIRYGAYYQNLSPITTSTTFTTTSTTSSSIPSTASTDSNITTTTPTAEAAIPQHRLLWTQSEQNEYANALQNDELGSIPYLTLSLIDPPFISTRSTQFGATFLNILTHIIGTLHQVYSIAFGSPSSASPSTAASVSMSDSLSSSHQIIQNTITFALVRAFIAFITKSAASMSSGNSLTPMLSMISTNLTQSHPICQFLQFVVEKYNIIAPELEKEYNFIISQRCAFVEEVANIERDSYLQSYADWYRLYQLEQEEAANVAIIAASAPQTTAATTVPQPTTRPSRQTRQSNTNSEQMEDIDAISFDGIDENVINNEERRRFIETLKQDQLFLNSGQFQLPNSTSSQYKALFPKK